MTVFYNSRNFDSDCTPVMSSRQCSRHAHTNIGTCLYLYKCECVCEPFEICAPNFFFQSLNKGHWTCLWWDVYTSCITIVNWIVHSNLCICISMYVYVRRQPFEICAPIFFFSHWTCLWCDAYVSGITLLNWINLDG